MLIMRSAISAAGERGQSGSLAGALPGRRRRFESGADRWARGSRDHRPMRDDLRRRPSGSRPPLITRRFDEWHRGLDAQDGVSRLNRADFGEWIYSFIDLLSTLGGEKNGVKYYGNKSQLCYSA